MKLSKAVFAACLFLLGLQKNVAQSADPLTYIPKQAQNIYVLNMPSIIPKMDVNALKNMDFMKEIMEKANNPQVQSYLQNPAEAGIDLMKPITLVVSQLEDVPYQTTAIIVALKNSEKLNSILEKSGLTITQKDDLSIVESDTSVLAWNKQMFVVVSLKKKPDPMSAFMPKGDMSNMEQTEIDSLQENVAEIDSLQTEMLENDSLQTEIAENDSTEMIIAETNTSETATMESDSTQTETAQTEIEEIKPKIDPSVYFQNSEVNAKAEALRALMRTPHDIYIYQTTDGASKSMKAMMASMLLGLNPTDLDGNVTTGWVDFEHGRMVGEATQKMNEAMARKFNTLSRAKPSVNWNNYITASNMTKPAMLVSFSLNPLGIKDFMANNELLKLAMDKNKKSNSSKMDKALAAFGGDVFFSFSEEPNNESKFLIGLSIADKKAAQKMVKEDKTIKKLSKNLYVIIPKRPVVTEDDNNAAPPAFLPKKVTKKFILFRDNVVLMGEEAQIKALKALPKLENLQTAETTNWQKALRDKPFNVFFDFNAMKKSDNPITKSKLDDIPFESMRLSMGNRVTSFEIGMNDKDQNALIAFFSFIDKMIKDKKEKTTVKE